MRPNHLNPRLSLDGGFSMPRRRFSNACVPCPLLHPLWAYPLRPLLPWVSGGSRERPNKLDRTGAAMLDKLFAALAPLLAGVIERIADKKIPDDTVPKFFDGLLDIARDGVDRTVGVVQTTADRIAGSAEAELGQLGTEIQNTVKAANPLDIIGKIFRR